MNRTNKLHTMNEACWRHSFWYNCSLLKADCWYLISNVLSKTSWCLLYFNEHWSNSQPTVYMNNRPNRRSLIFRCARIDFVIFWVWQSFHMFFSHQNCCGLKQLYRLKPSIINKYAILCPSDNLWWVIRLKNTLLLINDGLNYSNFKWKTKLFKYY